MPTDSPTRRLIVLGSTGSIGTQTLDVLRSLRTIDGAPRFEVVGLAAGSNHELLFEQAREFGVKDVALASSDADAPSGVTVRTGEDSAETLVREIEADVVMSSIVGVAGLAPTLAALRLGRDVALANKEPLVAAGALVTAAARESGSALLPVDSEHSAVWQCIGLDRRPPIACGLEIRRVTLTASGGAFLGWDPARVAAATPEEALAHPTWDMGAKVTVDTASLMNKGLELLEAHWLFGLEADRLSAAVQPGSVAHALVEYADGSVIAQLGAPDMRTPIQLALTAPDRFPCPSADLPAPFAGELRFEPATFDRYPALALADRVMREGGLLGAALNGANEAAVAAFLAGRIRFGRIVETVGATLDRFAEAGGTPARDLADVLEMDRAARAYATDYLDKAPAPAGR